MSDLWRTCAWTYAMQRSTVMKAIVERNMVDFLVMAMLI
jgi:hypothetical protein